MSWDFRSMASSFSFIVALGELGFTPTHFTFVESGDAIRKSVGRGA